MIKVNTVGISMRISLLLIFFLAIFMPHKTSAISTAEYQDMLKDSAFFRQMDEKLGQTWKEAIAGLNKHDKQWLLEIQREWLKFGRDESASEFERQGYSRQCAYALATKRQIYILQGYGHNFALDKSNPEEAWADDYYEDELLKDLPAECGK